MKMEYDYSDYYVDDDEINCGCYGCATMRHPCEREKRFWDIKPVQHKMNLKTYFRHKDKTNGDKTRG